MNKVKELEFKRLLKELDYIESDFEYRNEIISEADHEFLKSINNFLQDHPALKKIYDDKVTEKINQTIEKSQKESEKDTIDPFQQYESEIPEESQNFEVEEPKDEENNENVSKLKKLYREIAKLTHPDKVKVKRLNDLYIKSTEYYNDDNLIGILAICNKLDIEYEISEDDVNVISNQINKFKSKINFLENTYTWHWYNCKDDVKKSQILLNYIKLKIA
jgi:hypothetical protein